MVRFIRIKTSFGNVVAKQGSCVSHWSEVVIIKSDHEAQLFIDRLNGVNVFGRAYHLLDMAVSEADFFASKMRFCSAGHYAA